MAEDPTAEASADRRADLVAGEGREAEEEAGRGVDLLEAVVATADTTIGGIGEVSSIIQNVFRKGCVGFWLVSFLALEGQERTARAVPSCSSGLR